MVLAWTMGEVDGVGSGQLTRLKAFEALTKAYEALAKAS